MDDHGLAAIAGSLAAALCYACMCRAGDTAGAPDGYRIAASTRDWWYSDYADECDACGISGPGCEIFTGWFVPV